MKKSTGKAVVDSEETKKLKRRQAPGSTVEHRENQLISMAVDLAAKQIKNGTASSQVITHFLKLGSTLASLEKVKLEQENQLLQAKTDSLHSQKKIEVLYTNAMKAFRGYRGEEEVPDGNDEEIF